MPVVPMEDSRRVMGMEWLMVSKAALTPRRMRIEREPELAERRMSLMTFNKAVSVTCLERKMD